jgi:ssDNA-binding Zn-finger/Zn-ribbon topoisomerase 1
MKFYYRKQTGISDTKFTCPKCGEKKMYYSYGSTMYICENYEHRQVETPK